MKTLIQCAIIFLLLLTLNSPLTSARAQGTAFTYQGRLNSAGSPANGLFDFRFRLDADPAGNTILTTVLTNSIGVTNGLFTTAIDFGAGWFNGSNYWLEVDVKTNNFATYTALSPLQPITPAPYAAFANTASNLSGSVSAAQLSGTILNSSLPSSPSFSGTVTANNFSGNGGGLTNLNASQLTSGVVPQGVLPGFQVPYSTIGGGTGNNTGVAQYATVSGGGANGGNGNFSTVGGGSFNLIDASGDHSTIGGGYNNHVVGYESTIGGGYINLINGQDDVIGGGDFNVINLGANQSFIGGGINNTNTGSLAIIPGGDHNVATNNSFAAGHRAKAVNPGAFVWADSQDTDFSSTATNQFLIRAQGGVGINMNNPNGASLYVQGNRTNGWPNSMSWFENAETGADASPALRVVVDGRAPGGALSVSVQGGGLIAQFGNGIGFVSQLDVNGNWTANSFSGGGGGLTGLSASNLTGALPAISGANLTNLNAAQLASIGNTNGSATGNFFVGLAGNAKVLGSYNTGAGDLALSNNTAGSANTADGFQALASNTGGSQNTAVGAGPLSFNTSGSENTAVGYGTLAYNTIGNYNTAEGSSALLRNTNGNNNTALGRQALYYATTGASNTAVGAWALAGLGALNNAGGSNNIALGFNAGANFTANESGNIDIGNLGFAGDNNIIRIGSSQALTFIAGFILGNGGGLTNLNAATLKADGAQNVLVGSGNAVGGNGTENTAVGYQSFYSNNEGDFNTAVGYKALFSNTGSSDYSGGNFNTASGFQSLYYNTIGDANVADGGNALYYNVSGYNNTAIGVGALYQLGALIAGGSNNIALGFQAGYNFTGNESTNIDIGSPGVSGDNKTIRIGTPGIHTQTYLAGVINGNGSGLTSLGAANLTGSLPAISGASLTSLPANAALLNAGSQTFTGRNSFNLGIGVGTASALEGNLNINTNTYLFSHVIYLRGETGTDHNHGLAYNGNSITNFGTGNVQVDGPVLWGFSGGALAVVNGGAHAVLTWTNGGVSVTGGFAFSSDRDMKTGFEALDAQEVLAQVAALPLSSWYYKTDTGARHFGPMAQDFHAAFALGGGDDKHINVGDEGGVALAAIQGLNQKLDARAAELENAMKSKNDEIERLKLDNSNLEKRLNALEKLAGDLLSKK